MNAVNEGVILWDLEHLQTPHFIAQALEYNRGPCCHQKKLPSLSQKLAFTRFLVLGPAITLLCSVPSSPHRIQAFHFGPVHCNSTGLAAETSCWERRHRWYHLGWQQHRRVRLKGPHNRSTAKSRKNLPVKVLVDCLITNSPKHMKVPYQEKL